MCQYLVHYTKSVYDFHTLKTNSYIIMYLLRFQMSWVYLDNKSLRQNMQNTKNSETVTVIKNFKMSLEYMYIHSFYV